MEDGKKTPLEGTDMTAQLLRDGIVSLDYCEQGTFLLAPFELDAVIEWWHNNRDRAKRRWDGDREAEDKRDGLS